MADSKWEKMAEISRTVDRLRRADKGQTFMNMVLISLVATSIGSQIYLYDKTDRRFTRERSSQILLPSGGRIHDPLLRNDGVDN